MKICKVCGNEESNKSKFCSKCGGELEFTKNKMVEKKYCEKCNKYFELEKEYCSDCGQKLVKVEKEEKRDGIAKRIFKNKKKEKTSNYIDTNSWSYFIFKLYWRVTTKKRGGVGSTNN